MQLGDPAETSATAMLDLVSSLITLEHGNYCAKWSASAQITLHFTPCFGLYSVICVNKESRLH